MKQKLAFIAERRKQLIRQTEQQREALKKSLQPLQSGLAIADKSLNILKYVKKHSVIILGIASLVGLLSLIKPIRSVNWLRYSWITGLAIRGLRIWLAKTPKTK